MAIPTKAEILKAWPGFPLHDPKAMAQIIYDMLRGDFHGLRRAQRAAQRIAEAQVRDKAGNGR